MSVRPGPPFCEMLIDVIGVERSGHATASSISRRLAWGSAKVLASSEAAGRASKSSMRSPLPAASAASVAPTGPAPTIATSGPGISATPDGFLDVLHALRTGRGEDLPALRSHEDIVLDANADVP